MTVPSYLAKSRSQGDGEIRFSYKSDDTSSEDYYLNAYLRQTSGGDAVTILIKPSSLTMNEGIFLHPQ